MGGMVGQEHNLRFPLIVRSSWQEQMLEKAFDGDGGCGFVSSLPIRTGPYLLNCTAGHLISWIVLAMQEMYLLSNLNCFIHPHVTKVPAIGNYSRGEVERLLWQRGLVIQRTPGSFSGCYQVIIWSKGPTWKEGCEALVRALRNVPNPSSMIKD